MTIHLEHAAMRTAMADVTAAAERLADERSRADQRMSGLLGAGWTGMAAESFAEAWDDWLVAADQVKGGLDAMAQLLDAVHRDMSAQDEGSQRALDQISQRIVDRLG